MPKFMKNNGIIFTVAIILFFILMFAIPRALKIEADFEKQNLTKYQHHNEWRMEIRSR